MPRPCLLIEAGNVEGGAGLEGASFKYFKPGGVRSGLVRMSFSFWSTLPWKSP